MSFKNLSSHAKLRALVEARNNAERQHSNGGSDLQFANACAIWQNAMQDLIPAGTIVRCCWWGDEYTATGNYDAVAGKIEVRYRAKPPTWIFGSQIESFTAPAGHNQRSNEPPIRIH